jgi:hypothetical protein
VISVLCGSATGQASHHPRPRTAVAGDGAPKPEPLPLRRVGGKTPCVPDPGGQAIYRLAFAEYLFDYVRDCRMADIAPGASATSSPCLGTATTKEDWGGGWGNSKVTSIAADRH